MSVAGRTPDHHGHAFEDGPRPGPPPVAEPLSYAVGRALGTVVVTVHGHVDVAGSEALERVIDDLVEGQGNRAVAVDLRKATLVSPDVLDVFYAVAHRARRRGTSFTVTAPALASQPDGATLAEVINIDRPPRH